MTEYTIVNSGGSWNSPSTFSPLGVPVNGDTVIGTATSGPLTVTANASCSNLDLSLYANTFTVNAGVTLTISGNTTFSSGMTTNGTGTLSMVQTSLLTSAGKTWTGSLRLGGGLKTYTLVDNWTIDGNLTVLVTNNTYLNGNSINVNGGYINSTAANYSLLGTTNINMTGSGTISSNLAATELNFTIDTIGVYTIATFLFAASSSNKTLKYIKGTISGTKILTLRGGNFMILDCSGLTWNTVQYSAGNAITTLISDLNVANSISWSVNSTQNLQVLGGKNVNFSGSSFALFGTTGCTLSGNVTVNFYGSPTITSNGISTTVSVPLVFNCGSNNVTFPQNGNVTYTKPITFNSLGSLITTNNTFRLGSGSSIINYLTGITFNNIAIAGNTSFSGTEGFTVSNLTGGTANAVLTLQSNNSYYLTSGINLAGTATSPMTLSSSTLGNRAILVLNNTPNTTQAVAHINTRDIDSSLGKTIWNYKGTLTNNLNWNSLTSVTRNPNISSST